MAKWNPWHGCHKISEGCRNCYVYRMDASHELDASIVTKNREFDLPLKQTRNGDFKLKGKEIVYTCFTSDFFLAEADDWRVEAWRMIRIRTDLHFFIITKRIDRFKVNLPADWGNGYDNVTICSTCENQDRTDYRMPIFLDLPIRHKMIICEPILERINLEPYLSSEIEGVVLGGESGNEARPCDYDWVLDIREQCLRKKVSFHFRQTGAKFIKDGRLYRIKKRDQINQAFKAGIDYQPDILGNSNMKGKI